MPTNDMGALHSISEPIDLALARESIPGTSKCQCRWKTWCYLHSVPISNFLHGFQDTSDTGELILAQCLLPELFNGLVSFGSVQEAGEPTP